MHSDLKIIRPIQEFFRAESIGGIILLISATIAMILANSPWESAYFNVLNHHIEITLGEHVFSMDKTVAFWINDLLMAIFFFVIGLEIKREIMAGELSSIKAASLPIAAAIGGMVVPALCYLAFNSGPDARGWAVPMATDIAFTLGILSLFGKRIPLSLKVFLTALAIVDDLSGVLVIALFYTEQLNTVSLLSAGGVLVALMLLNYFNVYKMSIYAFLGLALWLFVYESGIHPTVAGVLLAMTIPAKRRLEDLEHFKEKLEWGEALLFDNPFTREQVFLSKAQSAGINHIFNASRYAMSPVQRLEHALHPFVAFFVMPLFALANAGVPLDGLSKLGSGSGVFIGIIAGLVLGKQIGIMFFTWLAVKLKLGVLPADLDWKLIYGLSCLAGVGFTMSFFIGNLAFEDPAVIIQSKLGILAGSLIAGVMGWGVLTFATRGRNEADLVPDEGVV